MAPSLVTSVQDDPVALAEIELCGELMIAASTSCEERLSVARIDEVLEVAPAADRVCETSHAASGCEASHALGSARAGSRAPGRPRVPAQVCGH